MTTGSRFLALSLISLAAACGGGGGDGDDVQLEPDADVVDQPDAEAPRVCNADATYGTATIMNAAAESQGPAATPDGAVGGGTLNADAMPDAFQLELYKGFGIFTDTEIVPGTYTLSGTELNYATCGVCPRIFSNVDTASGMAQEQYFVTGGSVTITQVNPNLQFTVSDLTFVEVTINETTFESTPVVDGCESAIASMTFDAVVTNTP